LPDPYPTEPNEDCYLMGGILMHKKKEDTTAPNQSSLNLANLDLGTEYPRDRYIEGSAPITLYYPSP